MLSSVAETPMVVENSDSNTDVRFTVQRSTWKSQETIGTALPLPCSALADAGVEAASLTAVELLEEAHVHHLCKLQSSSPSGSESSLNTTLDSASAVSTGSACFGAGLSGIEIVDLPQEEAQGLHKSRLTQWLHGTTIVAQDTALEQLQPNLSLSHSYLLPKTDMDKHKALLDRSKIEPLLNTNEEWLYSEDADTATVEDFKSKHADLKAKIEEICKRCACCCLLLSVAVVLLF